MTDDVFQNTMTQEEIERFWNPGPPRPLSPEPFDREIAVLKKVSGIAAKNQLELLQMARRRLFGED